jgi:hypothetical protein
VVEARTPSDIKYWGTENAQKRYIRLLACSGSRERLEAIFQDLRVRGEPLEHLHVVPPVAEFLRYYASTRDLPMHRELLSQPEAVVGDLSRFAQLAQYQKTLFRDEISLLRIEPSIDGRGWVLPIVFGLLPDSDVEQAIADLLPEWITHGVSIVRLPDDGSAPMSPIDHPILVTIGQLLTERYGQVPNGPFYQTRSTNDARLFRREGIPSYGFSPFLVLSTDTAGVGGINESLALPGYIDGVDMYVDLVRRLVGAT